MFFLFKREAFMEGMFTMASATFKSLLLEEKFPLDSIGRCHKAKNIPWFNVLIQEEDNAPKATIDLVIESLEFPNHFLHHTEPFGVQSKLSVRDEWAQLYCYKELLSSTLRSWHIRLGKPLKILCKRGIPSLVILFVTVESNMTLQNHGLDGSVANIAVIVECCKSVSTANFSWSILYTRTTSRISPARIASLSQDSSKINPRFSQFASLSFLV